MVVVLLSSLLPSEEGGIGRERKGLVHLIEGSFSIVPGGWSEDGVLTVGLLVVAGLLGLLLRLKDERIERWRDEREDLMKNDSSRCVHLLSILVVNNYNYYMPSLLSLSLPPSLLGGAVGIPSFIHIITSHHITSHHITSIGHHCQKKKKKEKKRKQQINKN